MAIEIEFWDERAESAIALLSAGEPTLIPATGDWCVVPETGTGMFPTVQVRSRHFYYGPDGQLRRVRVSCKVAKAQH